MIQSKQAVKSGAYINNIPAYLVKCPKCDKGFWTAKVESLEKRKCQWCSHNFSFIINVPPKFVTVEVSK